MKKAILSELLYQYELLGIKKEMHDKYIKDLTVSELNSISITLIILQGDSNINKELCLSSNAINILSNRAIEKNLSIL